MKRLVCLLLCTMILIPYYSEASESNGYVTVTAKLLNGRMSPSKGAMKTAFFDRGDILELTGRWSNDRDWVEVYSGESGASWVARQYVTERTESFFVINNEYPKVKIRKRPSEKSKVSGYLRKGHEIEITQVLLGWGKCKLGWIDLSYVQEED